MKNEYGVQLDRNGYAPSIVTFDTGRCFLCEAQDERLDRHECFGGALRDKSKQLGLWVPLCHTRCHLYGVHQRSDTRLQCQQAAQKAAMQQYGWNTEDFIREFGKNYL